MFESKIDVFNTKNTSNKKMLEKLYNYIEDYFENCEKYGLQVRDGQYQMALSTFDAIESYQHLIIEAGVGIGKSYAYLIPLLYYHSLADVSFIISTSTIALQEQLEKDIAKLSKQLRIPIDVVVAKGMTNFICLNRLENFLKSQKEDSPYLNEFVIDKQDRKDYPTIKDDIWNMITVDGCSYNRCENCTKCEFYKRRTKMKTITGAIICNHDLLVEELSRISKYERQLFRNVAFIICDEAHNLENKVRSAKTKEIKISNAKSSIRDAIKRLEKIRYYEFNYNKIASMIDGLSKQINNNVLKTIEEIKKDNIDLDDFSKLEFKFDKKIIDLSDKILIALKDLNDSIQMFLDEDTEILEDELNGCIDMFRVLSQGNKGNYLFWIERKKNKNYIYYAPKNIDEISYNLFFKKSEFDELFNRPTRTFIFTSATLSTEKKDYSYFMKNIGAEKVENGLAIEGPYDSPYDYDKNTMLYYCNDIANPRNKEKYLEQLVDKIKELIQITNGKALVLFTSKSDMNYVYSKVGNKIGDINIYIQNDGSSQDIIKNKFKDDINSVLFSTGIFWEGIDIKGPSLSNLIIARLPFPVADPILEYKSSLYGKDGFDKVYIPEMLIKLKQGVGRLIRSETDKGIVCILDSRMSKSEKYKDVVKRTLPIKRFVDNIDELKQFVEENKINVINDNK